jgi:cell division protein FtsQ
MAHPGDQPVNRNPRRNHAVPYPRNGGFSSGLLAILLLFAVAVSGVVWVSMGIVAKEQWPIRWLELNGSFQRVSADQMRGSLAPLVNASFFTVDLQQLYETAARKPWVASVSVQKNWPDTVTVTISEHVPIAHWNSGQLISTQGVLFSAPDADEIQGLPWLNGPDERLDLVLDQWTRFNLMLDSAALEIERLTLDERGSWAMQLNNGTRLALGRDQANERLERLMNSWATLLYHRDLPPVRVDLRYTNGFAVRWPKDATDFVGVDN